MYACMDVLRYKRLISHMTDGSVVGANTPRKSSPLGRLMTNSKIHKCAALGITMSTAIGCGFLCMPLYCGRLSEVSYMSLHQRWFDIIPPGFARLVDKGFCRTTRFLCSFTTNATTTQHILDACRYYKNYNRAYVPAHVRSDTKDLSGAALHDASKQSSDRYTCEVYFSRFVQFLAVTPYPHIPPSHTMPRVKEKSALLKGECRHYHWRHLDTAWCIGHYGANLQAPLRIPARFHALKAQYEALC